MYAKGFLTYTHDYSSTQKMKKFFHEGHIAFWPRVMEFANPSLSENLDIMLENDDGVLKAAGQTETTTAFLE